MCVCVYVCEGKRGKMKRKKERERGRWMGGGEVEMGGETPLHPCAGDTEASEQRLE